MSTMTMTSSPAEIGYAAFDRLGKHYDLVFNIRGNPECQQIAIFDHDSMRVETVTLYPTNGTTEGGFPIYSTELKVYSL